MPEFPADEVRAGDLVFFAGGDHLSRTGRSPRHPAVLVEAAWVGDLLPLGR